MKTKHLLFLLAAVPLLGGAAIFPKFDLGSDAALVLEGEIASQPVTVFLTIPTLINEEAGNTNIRGYYYYDLHKKNIELSGSVTNVAKEEGKTIYRAVITESDGSEDTGVFTLDINPYAATAKGSWSSLSAEKEFAVSLVPSAKLPFNKITFVKAFSSDREIYPGEQGSWPNTFSAEISFFSLENTKNPKTEAVLNKINEQGLGELAGENNIFTRFSNAIEPYYDDWDPSGTYSISRNYYFYYADTRLVSLVFIQGIYLEEMYTAASQSIDTVEHFLYSLETGERLNDVKLLVNNPESPGLIKQLRQKLTNRNIPKDLYPNFEKIRLTDNFSVQGGGFLFTYNEDKFAGDAEVFFSPKELAPFARKKGPFAHLFTDKP